MSLSCIPRFLKFEVQRCGFILASTPRFSIIPSAKITSKEWMDPNVKKPAPWPYETKKYTYLKAFWEGTVKRFDDNTKIIVVDGNIAAGKHAFAKELAEAFDMRFVPEANLERLYITPYGYDIRDLDPIAPPSFKTCDQRTFLRNPHHPNAGKFQFLMFMARLEDYVDALAHLLNTGQGIVMERSVYSDFVFIEAMHKAGYLRRAAKNLYYDICELTLEELLRPHLIIYLDVSPDVILERIKKRNDPVEVNSPVLTKEYLENIENIYKQKYLKEFQKHSELLIYDWNNYGDVEVVVEDIERIDFDRFTKYDTQMKDWRKEDDWEWGCCRRRYTNEKQKIMGYALIRRSGVPELFHPGEEVLEYRKFLKRIPGEQYADGFNKTAGDNVWFKTDHKGYRHVGYRRSLEH